MQKAGPVLIDVSAIDSEFRFDRDTLQGFGHPVLFCHGPGGGECPLLAEDACPLVEEAHGVIFELDLDVPVHREILLRYQQILAEDIPIRLLVKPGQIERYTDGHDDTTYELGGPAYNLTDLAAAITEVTGTEVVHRNLTADELIAAYTGFGMDEGTARFLAELDRGTAAGGWDTDSTDLATLLGRPTTPLIDGVRTAYSPSS
jgi:hypothetical protein